MNNLIQSFSEKYDEFLFDESKLIGHAETISFPTSKEEIKFIIKNMIKNETTLTIQGGNTGICGGAVPNGGHILNLSKFDKILSLDYDNESVYIKVQGGLTLSELQNLLYKRNFKVLEENERTKKALEKLKKELWFWPIEPTETSATIGGILSTDAKGICVDFYGKAINYVNEIVVIDGNGDERIVGKGKEKVDYYNHKSEEVEKIDALEFFLGSEGIFGVISEATLRLIKKRNEIWGIGFFFRDEKSGFNFIEQVKSIRDSSNIIAAGEYFDRKTLNIVQELKKVATKLNELPDINSNMNNLIYVELHSDSEEEIETIAMELMESASELGCQEEDMWALSGDMEVEKFRTFRHGAPEGVNFQIEKIKRELPTITKLSNDITIFNENFGDVVKKYRKEAMGHIAILTFSIVPFG